MINPTTAKTDHLQQAVDAGIVHIDAAQKRAIIVAPPNPSALTDEDWLLLLHAASEGRRELEKAGFRVSG